MTEIWMLGRGRHEPRVWPFESEEAAQEFALEHDMLDWRADRVDDPDRDHEAVCARCQERWPCRHVRVDRQAAMIQREAENRCERCGKQIGWAKVTFRAAGEFGQDVHYHGKLGACLNLARRLAHERGDAGALRDLARVDEVRERDRQVRALRAARRGAVRQPR